MRPHEWFSALIPKYHFFGFGGWHGLIQDTPENAAEGTYRWRHGMRRDPQSLNPSPMLHTAFVALQAPLGVWLQTSSTSFQVSHWVRLG